LLSFGDIPLSFGDILPVIGDILLTELSHVVQERAEGPKGPEAARPERAEAPSPGRALKKSPFLRTKTEKGYDL